MDTQQSKHIYEHTDYLNLEVNSGGSVIHARQTSGRFRNIKWLIMSALLIPFFALPYFSWSERQAILFDIPARKFYLFDIVVWPQDLIILALLMLFCFILLFTMTAIAGRIFCGNICPQSVWTDLMTFAEHLAEGKASERIKLDKMPWNATKIRKKLIKHSMWTFICLLTAITFLGYFSGIFNAWASLLSLSFNIYEWVTIVSVFSLFYINTGFVREQVCNWICPYARIQAVMTDEDTLTTTYDYRRGEERGRLQRGEIAADKGDCIDCNMCVSVCPTGIDIREGQQLGCINCGLCIDACDDIMDKIERPHGLIRFMSLNDLESKEDAKHHVLRLRPMLYMAVTLLTFIGIAYNLLFISPIDMNVNHERSPTYTIMSDRTVQNMYHLILMNKTEQAAHFKLSVSGIDGIRTNLDGKTLLLNSGQAKKVDLRIKVPQKNLNAATMPIMLNLQSTTNTEIHKSYKSMFFSPGK
ncbi:MAG: cytochrome c oxidase accessory protein CcoG [Mariprofundaceae bacterium]|nr:cytochrome c oxidase accessory protein CcoG [Mariprofundaceae bacterium]